MCLFSLQVTKNGIWKALVPSIGSRPEGPKCEKKTYFGYSGRHQVHMNFQPSPPPSPHVATPAKVSTAATAKIMYNIEFISVLKKLLTNLLLRKDNFRK
jgi:hypothetical protein